MDNIVFILKVYKENNEEKIRGKSKGRSPFHFNPCSCCLLVLAEKQKQLKRKILNGCVFFRESRVLSPDKQETPYSWSFNLWPWKLLLTQSSGDILFPLTSGEGHPSAIEGDDFHHMKFKFGKDFHIVTWVPMWQFYPARARKEKYHGYSYFWTCWLLTLWKLLNH